MQFLVIVELQIPIPLLVVENVGREMDFLVFVVVRLLRTSSKRDWLVCGEVRAR